MDCKAAFVRRITRSNKFFAASTPQNVPSLLLPLMSVLVSLKGVVKHNMVAIDELKMTIYELKQSLKRSFYEIDDDDENQEGKYDVNLAYITCANTPENKGKFKKFCK